MDFYIFCGIDKIAKKYTEAYAIYNRPKDLSVMLQAHVNEEKKECILNELDCVLPYGLNFSHTYENGKLQVIFKEDKIC